MRYYFAHLNNSSSADFLRVRVNNTVVFERLGAAANVPAVWQTLNANISSFAGQTVTITVEAADASGASLVEAAIDDVRIG
jgi:aminopeptidase S